MKLLTHLLLFILLAGASALSQRSGATNPIGTWTAKTVTCPAYGVSGGTCYAIDIICPNITDYTAYAKVFTPPDAIGTVALTGGGLSNVLWEGFTYGDVTVENLIQAHFNVADITFGRPFSFNGAWQSGGGGVLALSCRHATLIKWLSQTFPTLPLCAAGNSAGGDQLGEGLAHYGTHHMLTFVELVSGPPFQRIDEACLDNVKTAEEPCSGTVIGMGVGLPDAEAFLDPAYPPNLCSESYLTGKDESNGRFYADSITGPDAALYYPDTTVKFLFGGLDVSAAPRQGSAYKSLITSSTESQCVADAPHDLPDALDGAEQVAADMIEHCVKQEKHRLQHLR